jgi:hypothetical protein
MISKDRNSNWIFNKNSNLQKKPSLFSQNTKEEPKPSLFSKNTKEEPKPSLFSQNNKNSSLFNSNNQSKLFNNVNNNDLQPKNDLFSNIKTDVTESKTNLTNLNNNQDKNQFNINTTNNLFIKDKQTE